MALRIVEREQLNSRPSADEHRTTSRHWSESRSEPIRSNPIEVLLR
jgi:hypothetical protein